jgi:hypothetical protein
MEKIQGKIESLSSMCVGRSYRNGEISEHLFTCSGINVDFSALCPERLSAFKYKNGDYCILLGEFVTKKYFRAHIIAPLGGGRVLRKFKFKYVFCLVFSIFFTLSSFASMLLEYSSNEKYLHIVPFLLLGGMFFWLFRNYREISKLLGPA